MVLLCIGGLAVLGCKSPGRAEAKPLAAVVIEGNTPGQISVVVADVFQKDGYKVARNDFRKIRLEKVGSRMDNVAYGNWTGEDVWTRVEVTLVPLAEGKIRLECEAWHVRDPGHTLEEVIKVGSLHRRPYQKLLDEVAARFRR